MKDMIVRGNHKKLQNSIKLATFSDMCNYKLCDCFELYCVSFNHTDTEIFNLVLEGLALREKFPEKEVSLRVGDLEVTTRNRI